MRNLLWRGLAVALAGCVGWLLAHPRIEETKVEFELEPPCSVAIVQNDAGELVCWKNGQRVVFPKHD